VNPEAKKITDAQKKSQQLSGRILAEGVAEKRRQCCPRGQWAWQEKKMSGQREFLIDKKCLHIIYMIWLEQSQLPKLNI